MTSIFIDGRRREVKTFQVKMCDAKQSNPARGLSRSYSNDVLKVKREKW
jgi:hypothetical protein